MDTRREFIKKAAMIAGATGFAGVLPASIQRALAIDPPPGTTWLDAEHVVLLMQENRSFDHSYGNLRGVRGYRDPRAVTLENSNKVWLQTNAAGDTYAPFRLDIRGTMATWMGSLPHSWTNQVDARNHGKYDKWLQAKPSGHKDYAQMPLTLGYYDRRDIPFYYSFADAFTVCDQNFCSSLTGTTPNRLYLWTGTIRDGNDPAKRARVRNGDTDYRVEAGWTTFPERLEDMGVDWRIYQNEISAHPNFKGEQDAWLSNFTDNPIEWFSQYNVRLSEAYMPYIKQMIEDMSKRIAEGEQKLAGLAQGSAERKHIEERLADGRRELAYLRQDLVECTPENYGKLSQRAKNLHQKAFTRNIADPHFHELTTLQYKDGDKSREAEVPKGDVLHQFRADVEGGKLPTVSWLVAPENFSDHPGAPWYGAWYVSEVLDILTKNPEVWKKTIFVLCYDENDGYFDHVPPFVAPDPARPETGQVSEGIDASVEYQTTAQDRQRADEDETRGGPIGLGYRVPLVIASPWSRGGYVNSQVFDHTSILQMMEKLITHKTGRKLEESNITNWRRTVCGDLSSVFRPYKGEKISLPAMLGKDATIESIHKAKFRELPSGWKKMQKGETFTPPQERGTKPSNALPYELYCEGRSGSGGDSLSVSMRAGKDVFGDRSAGSPFNVYAYGKELKVRHYAVKPGDQLTDDFPLSDFADGKYNIQVQGPNGFYRVFSGSKEDPGVIALAEYEMAKENRPSGKLLIRLVNTDPSRSFNVVITDNTYGGGVLKTVALGPITAPDAKEQVLVETKAHGGWYDVSVAVEGVGGFERRYAGRVETGKDSISDPAMG
jgi:phospholipase C